jgi:hypothetical protein
MKKKTGILIEEGVMRLAQCRAAEEGISVNDVIQEALVFYLGSGTKDHIKRLKAYKLFCEQPMRISRRQFKEILKEENFKSI